MKKYWDRLLIKLISFKALFTITVLVLVCTVTLSPANASVLSDLIYAVLGAKAVQYVAGALKKDSVESKED